MREYSNSQVKELIEEWIHSKRDRYVLYLRFIDGKRIDDIIDDVRNMIGYEMSYRQIQRIIAKGATVIFSHYE